MWIHDHSNYAIRGTDVNGFSLNNSVVNGTNGTNDLTNDSSVYFDNQSGVALSGSASVTNSHIQGGLENNLWFSQTAGTLNLTIDTVTIGPNSTTLGNQGITIEGRGTSTMNALVQNTSMTASRSTHFQYKADGDGGGELDYLNNSVSQNHPAVGTGGGAVLMQGGARGGTVDINVNGNNTFRGATGSALIVEKTIDDAADPGTATFNATVNNATIGVAATANSGSSEGSGLRVEHEGGGTVNATITNNSIHQYNNFGMDFQGGDGIVTSGTFNLTVTGNLVSSPGNSLAGNFQGIRLNNGVSVTDNFQTCYRLLNNQASNSGRGTGHDLRMLSRGNGTVKLAGGSSLFVGGPTDDTAATNWLLLNNTAVDASAVRGDSGTWTSGSSCP
jgi:hypothetical protein